MNAPAPPATTCRGKVIELTDQRLVLAIPGTDYRLHLQLDRPLSAEVGDRIEGSIHTRARRIDRTGRGGCFVDPVIGRPSNIQGRIIAAGIDDETLTVDAGVVMQTRVSAPQHAADFTSGEIIGFAIEPGATWIPAR